MSTKIVDIVQDGSYRAAQPTQVLVAEGNSVEFRNGPGGGTELVLTPESISILSPTPDTIVHIDAGGSVSFQFKKPSVSNYCAQVLAAGTEPYPIQCGPSGDGAVLTILSSDLRGTDSRTGRGL